MSYIEGEEKGEIFNKLLIQKSMLIMLMTMLLAVTVGSLLANFKVGADLGYYSGLVSLGMLGACFYMLLTTFSYDSHIVKAQQELRYQNKENDPIKLDYVSTRTLLVLVYVFLVSGVVIFCFGTLHLMLRGETLAQIRGEYFQQKMNGSS